ncbi:MAG: glycine zipper 2TM domain-containing protein [Usitatibacter sp.]
MKKLALIIASLMTAGSAIAAEQFNDQARVLNVRPIQERIPVSREECWNDTERGYQERRVTRSDTGASIGAGTVLGAIVGGVLGHQVGGGRGKDAATAGGAVVGGLIGNQADRNNRGDSYTEVERVPVDRTVERCRTINEVREATMGYDVEYEYGGRSFVSRMDRDPGRELRVSVSVQPIEGNELPPGRPGRPGRGPGAPVYRP